MRRIPAVLALGALTATLVAGWRYRELDVAVAANRRALAAGLRPTRGTPADGDASRRVADVVERDEALFDATVWLMTVRHTTGWLCVGCGAVAVALGMLARRPPRGRA